MASKKRIYKKGELQQYLAGKLKIDSGLVEVSSLTFLANSKISYPSPGLFSTLFVFCLFSIGILNLCLYYFNGSTEGNITWYAGYSLVALGTLNFLFSYFKYTRGTRRLRQLLSEPLEEIVYLREYLKTYLRQTDQRTSKYFSCITNNKVSNYLILSNFLVALQGKIEALENLAEDLNTRKLFQIYKILCGEIHVYDGVGPASGNLHQIPFAKLAETIDNLIVNLEKSLDVLEDDLANEDSKINRFYDPMVRREV